MTFMDPLHSKDKPQRVFAEQAGCSQSAISELINGRLTGRETCGRKRSTRNRVDHSLKRTAKETLESFTRWSEAGVATIGLQLETTLKHLTKDEEKRSRLLLTEFI